MKIVMTHEDCMPEWSAFEKEAWEKSDIQHYGKPLDWTVKHYILTAQENGKDIGSLRAEIVLGVCYIDTLIVAKENRSQGIGGQLLKKIEQICKGLGVHKLHLITGKNWDSVQFYQSFNFTLQTDIPDHFYHVDFVAMTKSLNEK